MNKKQIRQKIREILPPEMALGFHKAEPYLQALRLEQAHPKVIEKLELITKTTNVNQDEYLAIYDKLANYTFTYSETKGRHCIVTGEESLLNFFGDGETHLKTYPEINFNGGLE
ncbi:hypothetical protein [Vibrio barjaei]|uniref:hypothetical protein n=1 Tax=Vibrio barjaei TaxID=1676683 RepID=UPI002283930E|nr:hypothetical protein [Vibrio barjaei]MCY9874785.1 hypothetical protein [Vibrio barjaei]